MMTIATATSKNGVLIRLTDERWQHITDVHLEIPKDNSPKVMKVIKSPEFILKGSKGELLAIQKVPRKKLWIVVPYKEITKQDGFVLTAYFTSDLTWLLKKEILWSKQ